MPPEMVWPSGSDYLTAVQQPSVAFRRGDLRQGQVREGLFGLPASASGQSTIVFTCEVEDTPLAVRCFTKAPDHGKERFEALGAKLDSWPNPAFVTASWVHEGIRVDGRWWPVVVMPWIEGDTLNVAVKDRLDDPASLRRIGTDLIAMVRSFEADGIAHGDLQHGNILVRDDGSLRLVDYDAVWIAGVDLPPPNEVGQPNFQHPERLATGAWGPVVDSFSALVIHLSLLAVATEPGLWDKFHTGENLIFNAADFERPQASELFAQLRRLDDAEVRRLTDRLESAIRAPLSALGPVDGLIDGTTNLQLVPAATLAPPTTSPSAVWWEDPHARLADELNPAGVSAGWSDDDTAPPAQEAAVTPAASSIAAAATPASLPARSTETSGSSTWLLVGGIAILTLSIILIILLVTA